MDCGIPFCHSSSAGCPLGNLIPEWNDLVRRGRWDAATERLHATNNFPEFTGRVCPAPCEAACVLALADTHTTGSVTIKRIEQAIADAAWEKDLVPPVRPALRTGKERRSRRIGSGGVGRGTAAHPGGARGHGVRARRPARWAVAVRHPRVQAREEGRRTTPFPDARGGNAFRHRGGGRCGPRGVGSAGALRCSGARHRALLARDNPDVQGRGLDGVHLAMEHLVASTRV